MGVSKWWFVLLFLIACQSPTGRVTLENQNVGFEQSDGRLLFIEPSTVQKQQAEFVEKLKNTTKNQRPLYEEYIDVIGANGILTGIETIWPKCHIEAHDLGKIIYARLKNVEKSLRVCAEKCYTGCMHGVLMEAFAGAQSDEEERHVDLNKLKPMMNEICLNNSEMLNSYGPGECAHGVGHAIMFLSGYHIQDALDGCAEFDDAKMEYYCADGGYMEYVQDHDKEDAKTKSLFYPCDTFDFPAGCARAKIGPVASRLLNESGNLTKVTQDLIHACQQLEGKFRLGCFHGIGNAYSGLLVSGTLKFQDVCFQGSEEEQIVCIEGTMQYLGKYAPDKASVVCEQLVEKKEICLAAARNKLYNMEKDLTLYLKD